MRKLISTAWMSLDGVFDADTMDQWFLPFMSEEKQNSIRDLILASDAMVMGRVTYEMLAPYWTEKTNNEEGFADHLNSMPKYVVSCTLNNVAWNNSTLIKDNVIEELTRLKEQSGRNMLMTGSATLVKSLMASNVIDEYQLLMHPIVMGAGKRFFTEDMPTTKLTLVKTETLGAGVNLLRYKPAKVLAAV
jgi:dihydrofolate reductase